MSRWQSCQYSSADGGLDRTSVRPPVSWWPVVRAGAVGMVMAGAGAAVVAAFVLPDDLSPAHRGRQGLGVLTVATLLLLAAGGAAALQGRERGRRAWLRLGLVATVGSLAWAVAGLVQQWGVGFPGPVRMLAAVAASAMVVGLLPLLFGTSAVARRRWPFGLLVGLTAGGAVLLAAGLLTAATPDFGLQARTAAYTAPSAVPVAVSRVAWRTETPTPINAVAGGGAGAVVTLEDGVEGVDGTTGAVRWVYRRHGSCCAFAQVSPDGRSVVLRWFPRGRWHPQVVVLDADTGRVRFTVGPVTLADPLAVSLSDQVWVLAAPDGKGETLVGRSVLDDRVLWRYHLPAGCTREPSDDRSLAGLRSGVVVQEQCRSSGTSGEQVRLVSLGPGPAPRWQYVIPLAGEGDGALKLSTSPDGSLVLATQVVTGSRVMYPVLDGATGGRLTDAWAIYDGYLGVPYSPSQSTVGAGGLVDLRTGHRVGPAPADLEEAVVLSAQTVWPAIDETTFSDRAAVVLEGRSGATHTVPLVPATKSAPSDLDVHLAGAPGALVAAITHIDQPSHDELIGLK